MADSEWHLQSVGEFLTYLRRGLLLVLAIPVVSSQVLAAGSSTSFTYQGRLIDTTLRASGDYDFTFALYDDATNGFQIGNTITNADVLVSNSVLAVSLDFGAVVFDGGPRWLEISVRKGTNDFTLLSPRQPITPTPYAISAANLTAPLSIAMLPPTVPRLDANQTFSNSNCFAGPAVLTNVANLFSGTFSGDGSALSNITSTAVRRAIAVPSPTSGTNYVLDFSADAVQLYATNNINFLQSTNRPPDGYYVECVWYVQSGATNRLLTFSPGWIPIGTLATNSPCVLASNKTAVIAFSVRGSGETNVVYAIARQE